MPQQVQEHQVVADLWPLVAAAAARDGAEEHGQPSQLQGLPVHYIPGIEHLAGLGAAAVQYMQCQEVW